MNTGDGSVSVEITSARNATAGTGAKTETGAGLGRLGWPLRPLLLKQFDPRPATRQIARHVTAGHPDAHPPIAENQAARLPLINALIFPSSMLLWFVYVVLSLQLL